MNKALFLDRDGTLIEHRPYLHRPEEVTLIPGTKEALHRARAAGYLLFLFTNQSGIGRGYFTLADVEAVHRRLAELIGLGPNPFTEICIAPEHPDQPSLYRKPSPRFIQEMVLKFRLEPTESWMIGDSPADWRAGLDAGVKSAAVCSGVSGSEILAGMPPNVSIHTNLASFVSALLGR
jgi:D-glycero-D-manno-heptose 1,7-bisphosphate phosphatase